MLEGVESGSYFYFVHSYYADPEDQSLVLGTTDYASQFCSVIARDNLVATQFPPGEERRCGSAALRELPAVDGEERREELDGGHPGHRPERR